jgi:glycosyltransferase involved in cell wall biosynthesis
MMVLISKKMSKAKIILAPRSGFIVNDISNTFWLKKFISYVFRQTDYVVCQSKVWRDLFVNLVPRTFESKFKVIENGIDLNEYLTIPILERENEVTILFMSWVDKNKGIFDLLSAIVELRAEAIDFKLVIAGNGSAYDVVQQFIVENNLSNSVYLHGWALGDEKFKLLESSDIFVLPTYFEGYPNSLIEAMACGKACVASSVGSIPDIIDDQVTGILVKKGDSKQLYNALKLLITDKRKRVDISIKAREITESRNSIETSVMKLMKLFDNNGV